MVVESQRMYRLLLEVCVWGELLVGVGVTVGGGGWWWCLWILDVVVFVAVGWVVAVLVVTLESIL